MARRVAAARLAAADPIARAKKSAATTARYADPAERQKLGKACKRGWARALKDPKRRERAREMGRALAARGLSKEAGAARTRSRFGWCPPEHLELARDLGRRGFSIEERKEIILAEVEGTPEHARRKVASVDLAMRLRVEREKAQAY